LEISCDPGHVLFSPEGRLKAALLTMIWHKRSTATPEHRWLRDLIAEILKPFNTIDRPLPD